MRVLVIGSGGREHALCWSIAASPLLSKLWCAPGNPGIAQVAECVAIGALDFPALVAFAQDNEIDLVVPGPEAPLVAGITDAMPDPMLELRDGNGTLIAENDNWREGPELEIQQSTLAPTNDLESAIITTLPSGPYTAVIHERTGQSGIGLFEVYNLQNP